MKVSFLIDASYFVLLLRAHLGNQTSNQTFAILIEFCAFDGFEGEVVLDHSVSYEAFSLQCI